MGLDLRRVRAIIRKELREIQHNRSLLGAMAILPLVFMIQPLIAVLGLSASAAAGLSHEHVLLYLLGIPVPGERQQGTLEPVLTTPIRREELLLGKALAAWVPSIAIAYLIDVAFLAIVALFGQHGIASALVNPSDLVAQVLFVPLLAAWSIWVGLAMSTRASDARVAQQLSLLASLPVVLGVVLIALDAISPSPELGVALAALFVVLDVGGWWVVSRLFDRERLIAGSRD
jgi:ABC-type Na+ efflux pump permease subunit